MNGDLEKKLVEHIEEGGIFQGKVLQFIDNFERNVRPRLVTGNGCEAKHAALKLEIVGAELTEQKACGLRWRNRLWGVLVAVALLLLGARIQSWGGDHNDATDTARNVPRSGVESHGPMVQVGR